MAFIGTGKPGGPGGNKVAGSSPDDATRKARPGSGKGAAGQSTQTRGSDRDATRKARPMSTGSGQSTATGPR